MTAGLTSIKAGTRWRPGTEEDGVQSSQVKAGDGGRREKTRGGGGQREIGQLVPDFRYLHIVKVLRRERERERRRREERGEREREREREVAPPVFACPH